MKRAAWINVAIGFWLVIAAFTGHSQAIVGARMANDLIAGVVLMGAALWYLGTAVSAGAASTLEIFVGGWLILSPFLLSYTSWADVVCGAAAIVVALINRQAVRGRVAV